MISNLLSTFINNWPYIGNTSVPFVVEDTGAAYRLIIKNTCDWYNTHYGCTMCNYTDRTGVHATDILESSSEQIITSLKSLGKNYSKIKFYVNGSFFNEDEVSQDTCIAFIKRLRKELGIVELCVETRPEYVSRDVLLKFKLETKASFEICFGLESVDTVIRNQCFHKGISYAAFLRLFHTIKDLCKVKVYLLIKPPFVSERLAIEDIITSVNSLISEGITHISYTPIAVQNDTLLEFLLQEKLYRPVWIWSIIEINSRLSDLRSKYPNIHLGGLDYYPEPLQKAFNCEHCSDTLLKMLKANRNLAWSDLDLECDCYNRWKYQIDNEPDIPIKKAITHAEEVLYSTINRSISIFNKTNSINKPKILRDIAKTSPINKYVLDNVGVENVMIPMKVDDYVSSLGDCTYSIELGPFHRGIHMSRLIERLYSFSQKSHTDILDEMERDLLFPSIPTNVEIKFSIMDTVTNPLTDNINNIMIDVACNVFSKNDDEVNKWLIVTIPFINACPCTKETSQVLFGKAITHTQRGRIVIAFKNCNMLFAEIINYIKRYISIYDLLKREDEVYIVNKAYQNALFCEDMCRQITQDMITNLPTSSGSISVKVITEESIHPHNAFAEKTITMKEYKSSQHIVST